MVLYYSHKGINVAKFTKVLPDHTRVIGQAGLRIWLDTEFCVTESRQIDVFDKAIRNTMSFDDRTGSPYDSSDFYPLNREGNYVPVTSSNWEPSLDHNQRVIHRILDHTTTVHLNSSFDDAVDGIADMVLLRINLSDEEFEVVLEKTEKVFFDSLSNFAESFTYTHSRIWLLLVLLTDMFPGRFQKAIDLYHTMPMEIDHVATINSIRYGLQDLCTVLNSGFIEEDQIAVHDWLKANQRPVLEYLTSDIQTVLLQDYHAGLLAQKS
jgi:hypothetical protein